MLAAAVGYVVEVFHWIRALRCAHGFDESRGRELLECLAIVVDQARSLELIAAPREGVL